METFSALLTICAGNSPVPGEFPTQRPVTRSFDIFFGLRLNKWLSKQPWGWWFETLSRPLWRHSNMTWNKTDETVLLLLRIQWLWYAWAHQTINSISKGNLAYLEVKYISYVAKLERKYQVNHNSLNKIAQHWPSMRNTLLNWKWVSISFSPVEKINWWATIGNKVL